jgi:hypothetical protein
MWALTLPRQTGSLSGFGPQMPTIGKPTFVGVRPRAFMPSLGQCDSALTEVR